MLVALVTVVLRLSLSLRGLQQARAFANFLSYAQMGDWLRLAARLFAWESAAPMTQRAIAAAASAARDESAGVGHGRVQEAEEDEDQLAPSAARAAEAVAATIGADMLSFPITKAFAAVPSMAPSVVAGGPPPPAPAAAPAPDLAAATAAAPSAAAATAGAGAASAAPGTPMLAQQPQGFREEAEAERRGKAPPRAVQPPSPSEGRGPKLAATPMRKAVESRCTATDAAVRHLVSLSRNTLLPENRNGHEAGASPGLYVGFHDTRTPTPSDAPLVTSVMPTIAEEPSAGGSPPIVAGTALAGGVPLLTRAAGQPTQPLGGASPQLFVPAAVHPRFEDIVNAVLAGQRAMRHASRTSGGASAGARCDISVGERKKVRSASVGDLRRSAMTHEASSKGLSGVGQTGKSV